MAKDVNDYRTDGSALFDEFVVWGHFVQIKGIHIDIMVNTETNKVTYRLIDPHDEGNSGFYDDLKDAIEQFNKALVEIGDDNLVIKI